MQTSDISAATRTDTISKATQDSGPTGTSDFHTFLTLLTAQMRNQDPLKPMDSTEFVAQLASFSAVEQQIETNSKLGELLGVLSDSPTVNPTEWLGKEVLRESDSGSGFDFVSEVRLDQGNTILVFKDGTSLNAEDVTAVRIPQNF